MSSEPDPSGTEAPLPKRAPRCPRCDAPSSAIRRWPQSSEVWRASCTRCSHAWEEASHRSFSDRVSGDLLVFVLMAGVTVIGLAIIVAGLLSLVFGASDSIAFGVTIVLCIIALVVIGKMRHDAKS